MTRCTFTACGMVCVLSPGHPTDPVLGGHHMKRPTAGCNHEPPHFTWDACFTYKQKKDKRMNRKEIERFRVRKSEDICKLIEELGYNDQPRQLQCSNGAHVSSLLHFLDDNPGLMEVMVEWIADNHAEEDNEECEEDEG